MIAVLVTPQGLTAQELPAEIGLVVAPTRDRLRAAMTLCSVGDWAAIRLATVDPAPSVRQLALSCWDGASAHLADVAALATDPDPTVRRTVAGVLGAHNDGAYNQELTALLGDSDAGVRQTAVLGLVFDRPEAALATLSDLLSDTPEVAAAAALTIESSGAASELSESLRASYERSLEYYRLSVEQPELAGAVMQLWHRLAGLETRFLLAAEAGDLCARSAAPRLGQMLESLNQGALGESSKTEDRFSQVLEMERDVTTAVQGYYTCTVSAPLEFGASALSSPFETRVLTAVTEVATDWESNFGHLRADLDQAADGGDLWLRTMLSVNGFLPDRPVGAGPPGDSAALAVAGHLRRDQLFRHEDLTRWNGGGFVRGYLPFTCFGGTPCRLRATTYGLHSGGRDEDYPTILVSRHDRLGADLGFDVTAPSYVLSIVPAYQRVRYEGDDLGAAEIDRLGAELTLDGAFQMALAATHTVYAEIGAVGDAPPPEGIESGGLNRDGTLLSGLVGVRFGNVDRDGAVQLYVLGGTSVPLLDDYYQDISPQVSFDMRLVLENRGGIGNFLRLELGGLRRTESSPRDFALQNVVESFVEFAAGDVNPYSLGVQGVIRAFYTLVDHLGPVTQVSSLRLNLVGGDLGVRFFVEEWLGFEIFDRVGAFGASDDPFEVFNRFTVSLFIPLGGYAFGVEEPIPW